MENRRTVGGRGRTWVAGLALLAAVAGACSSSSGEGSTGPTVPDGDGSSTTSATATTTTEVISYEVPETIDQAYVQKVVSAYDKVLGDAIRVLKRDGAVNDEFLKHLVALYAADELEFQQKFWAEGVQGGVLQKYRDAPGNPATRVVRLVRGDTHCLVAQVDQSFAEVLRPGEDPAATAEDDYLVFVPKEANRDPLGVNVTPWVAAFSGYKTDNSEPLEACGA